MSIPLVCSAQQTSPVAVVPAPQKILLHTNTADVSVHNQRSASARESFNTDNNNVAHGDPGGVDDVVSLQPDSIIVSITSTSQCGTVQGTVRFVSRKGGTPVGLMSIELDKTQSSNYALVPSTTVEGSSAVDFTLTVIDPALDARALVLIIDRTAQVVTYAARHTAEKITVNPATLSFGTVVAGTQKCRQITLSNPTATPVEVQAVELVRSTGEFTITPLPGLPFTLPAGQSVTVEICGSAATEGEFKDSIRVRLSCYGRVVTGMAMRTALVRVTMNDRTFGDVPVDTEQSQEVVIENISNGEVPVELYSVDWADKEHFRTEGLENDKFPIVLAEPGDTYTFTVYYKPTEEGVENSTIARFTGNTTLDKTQSTWTGKGRVLVSVEEPEISQLRLLSVAPQPLAGTGSVRYSLDFPAPVALSVYTMLGERVLVMDEGIQSAGEHTISVDSVHLLPGLYLFRVDAGGRSAIRTVYVRK